MPFSPRDLHPHVRPLPPSGVIGNDFYSRDALEAAAPHEGGGAYMAAADKWVEENDGHHFYLDSGETYYMIPRGRVPY
jgi:hypothetical protein